MKKPPNGGLVFTLSTVTPYSAVSCTSTRSSRTDRISLPFTALSNKNSAKLRDTLEAEKDM